MISKKKMQCFTKNTTTTYYLIPSECMYIYIQTLLYISPLCESSPINLKHGGSHICYSPTSSSNKELDIGA